MATVTSKDGTTIAYTQSGSGEPLLLVDGAMCYRAFGPMGALSEALSPHFTVYTYDRRGRGESGDTLPYAVEREIEDIAALIQQAGGSAYVYGISSGAALALKAVEAGLPIRKLAIYEPPFNPDESARPAAREYGAKLNQLLAEGKRGDAAGLFMTYVGMPEEALAGMKQSPVWPVFEGIAPTLAYDNAILGDARVPTDEVATINIPTLVMAGGAGLPFMQAAALELEKAIPNAQRRILEGQTHEVSAEVLAPVLVEFFQS
jgi:pimeloyl-ACP methyl ester carboxylesterase